MAKIYQVAFELAGKVAGTFNKSILTVDGQLGKLGERIKDLNQQAANIESFKRLKNQMQITGAEFTAAQSRVEELARQIRNTESPTKGLQREFESAKNKAASLKNKLSEQNVELHRTREALRGAGISTRDLVGQQERLAASAAKAAAMQQKLRAITSKQAQLQNKRGQLQGEMLGAAGLAYAMAQPIQAAIQFESAMADVKKVVNFDGDQQFKAMGNEIVKMSQRIPMAADGLAAIVAAAGQAGIAKNDLLPFAESAAKMATAFDISAEEAGTLMSKWRSSMGLSQEKAGALADVVNHLSNNMAANAAEISDIVKRQGALAMATGLNEKQTAALGAALVSGGAGSEIAATALKNLVLSLSAGTAATKSQQEAFGALGLDAVDMAKMMQDDAEGAIIKVMEALKEKPAEEQGSLAQLLFGKESLGAIAPLLTNLDMLKGSFRMAGDATQYAGSMQREYDERSKTTANNMQLMRNRLSALAIGFGTALLPGINAVLSVLAPMITFVADLTQRFPTLTAIIGGVAFGLIALKVAAIAGGFAWTFMAEGALIARKAVVLFEAAQWLLNAAMTANPIGLVVAGIAAAVAAVYRLISAWDKLVAAFNTGGVWEAVKVFFGAGGDAPSPTATQAAGTAASAASVVPHATGGIFNRPHVGMVAEAGAEAIVPLTDKARGMSVLSGAARALGVGSGGGINLTYAPQISMGGSGAAGIENALRSGADDMVAKLKQAMQQEQRLNYA